MVKEIKSNKGEKKMNITETLNKITPHYTGGNRKKDHDRIFKLLFSFEYGKNRLALRFVPTEKKGIFLLIHSLEEGKYSSTSYNDNFIILETGTKRELYFFLNGLSGLHYIINEEKINE